MTTNDDGDRFQLELTSERNPLKEGSAAVAKIVESIREHAGDFAPDRISAGGTPEKYSSAVLEKLLSKQKSSVKPSLTLTRSSPPEVFYTLSFLATSATVGFTFSMTTLLSSFAESQTAGERCLSIISAVKALAHLCSPSYGYGHSRADVSMSNDPRRESFLVPNRIYEAYWLNLLGQGIVDRIGRERVLAVPAFKLEELPDGSVLFLTRPTPFDFASRVARIAQASALHNLVDGFNFDTHLAQLMERSARLAPVARDWDPDIADLLELTLADVPYSDRQSRIAELNRYRAPEVTEWRPAQQLLEPDVDDVENVLDNYGVLAEKMAALLRKEVPSVMEATPASLPLMDYHFWHFAYAEEFKREEIEADLVPAVGAYLGEVIIRNLGGRWVPRKQIDESQLLLKDRVWLPFLRSRRYLRSVQSALDYSLAKFYRVVERHNNRQT